jgi:hypothetical protein
MTYPYSFKDSLQHAERITWRVDELIGADKPLDFGKPFMPEGLSRTAELGFLSPAEKVKLSQIRGHTYLTIFGVVEEFILPFVLDHARPLITGEAHQARAYLEFAAEEAKHIHLFRCFREAFAAGFGSPCEVIGPAEEIGRHVLSHPPLSVALLILQIEWMTQRHFTMSVQDERDMDPRFKSLLLHHWMEERQHAQIDTLMVNDLAVGMTATEVEVGFQGYQALGAFFDEGLKQQTSLDLEALERACGRQFGGEEREMFLRTQHQANRWTYIGSGMSHPNFLATLGALSPAAREAVEAVAPSFS